VVEQLLGGLHHDRGFLLLCAPDYHLLARGQVDVPRRVLDSQLGSFEAPEDWLDVFDVDFYFAKGYLLRR
jgi:hypothetical protein